MARFLGNECLHLTSDFPPQVSPGVLRREVPAKRGVCLAWCRRSRAGVSGGGCAARAPAGAVTGSREAEDVPGVQRQWRRGCGWFVLSGWQPGPLRRMIAACCL